jgi:sugar O-acyltransferase (sialic acid O-acetyltransferase NeuD family)
MAKSISKHYRFYHLKNLNMESSQDKDNIKLLILGTGTFAMEVADLVSEIPSIKLSGFVVSLPPYEPGSKLLGKPIYWIDDLPGLDEEYRAVCGIVTTKRYKFINQVEQFGIRFTSVIHPSSRISRMSIVGEGTVVNAGVIVSTHTQIGNHVLLNRGAIIGHHNSIGDFTTISPGANLGGFVTVGERSWVGLGANIIERISIGNQAIISAGSLVKKDVPDKTLVEGSPAEIITHGVDGY